MRKMKEAAVIVLSIAMVFGNAGVAKAATGTKVHQKESKVTKQVEVQSEDGDTEEESTISFDEESLNTRIGCFKEYKFQGVDAEKIQDVDFEYENKQNVLEVKKVRWYIGSGSEKKQTFYVPVAKKAGTEKVKATVTYENKNGDEVEKETEWTTFHVSEAGEGIVPFKSRDAFREIERYDKNKDGQISWDELNNLKSLWIDLEDNEYDDEDLGYLYKSENLEEVDLSGAKNEDIGKLKEIKNLKELALSGSFDSVKELEGLDKLEFLRISSDKLQDLSGISQLKTLTKLTIKGYYKDGKFKDVNDLKGLDQLTKLELSSNKLEDISAVGELTGLTELIIEGKYKDVNGLKGLDKLTKLELSSDKLEDINATGELKGLIEAKITGNYEDLNGLNGLNQLKTLQISSDKLQDISGIEQLTQLNCLSITGDFNDIKTLKKLVNLKSLRLSSGKLQDISGVEQIKNLNSLTLEGVFDNINGVKSLNNLTSIKLNSDNLVNVSVLNNLVKLQKINIEQSPKVDIGSLDKNRFYNKRYKNSLYVSDKVSAESILKYQDYEDCILQKGENLQKINREFGVSINYQYNSSNEKVVNNHGEAIGKGETDVTIIVSNNDGTTAKKTIHVKVQDADDLKAIDNKKNDDELPVLTQGCGKLEDDNLSAIQKNGNVYDLQTKKKVADDAKSYVSNYVYCNAESYGEYYRLDTKISKNDELYTSINNGTMKKQGLQVTKNIKNYFITKQGDLYRLNQNNEVEKIAENVKDIYKCFNADDQEYIALFKNGDMKFLGHYNKIISKNIKTIISNHYFISNENKIIVRGDDLADFYEKFTILDSNPKIVISGGFNLYGWLLLDKNKLYVSNGYDLNEVADNVKEISESTGDIYEDLNGNYFYIYYEYKDDKRVVEKKQVSYTDKDFTGISKDGTAYVEGNKILNDAKSMKPIRSSANNYDYLFVRKDGSVWGYQAPYIAKKILNYDGSSEEQGSTEDSGNQNATTEDTTKPTTEKKNEVKVAKITLSGISHQIAAGKKLKLTAKITNNATNKKLIWTTSNKKYATVSQNGIVTFNKKAKGKTVTITATAADGSKKRATFKVKIMKGAVKKITISSKKTVKAGKSIKLKAKVKASKGANKKLLWTSSNPKYAKVTSSGKVTASKNAKKKTVKITAMATDGTGKKNTVMVKIK